MNINNKHRMKRCERLAFAVMIAFVFSLYFVSANNINVGAPFVKVTLSEDGSVVKPVSITAQGDDIFYFSVENIKGVSLSSNEAELSSGESFNLELSFNSKDLKPGLYVGGLRIKSSTETT